MLNQNPGTQVSQTTYNVTQAIDQGAGTGLLVRVAVLCASVAFLDGADTASISVAAPRIADQLALAHWQLGPVFSAGLLGAMLGALSFGTLADRYGRRVMLIVATAMFGLFTLLTATVHAFHPLLLLRLLSGIGLGGATPSFMALASEYASSTRRARVTGLIWAAFTLGTVLGTFTCAYLISHHGWRSIFIVGGVVPLLVTLALLIGLPESLSFLLVKNRNPRLARRIARSIAPGLGENVRLVVDEVRIEAAPFASLFASDRRAETLLLWFIFAAVFGTTAVAFFWAPAMMRDHGIPLSRGAIVLGVSGIGSLVGSASAGLVISRFRPVNALAVAFCLGAAAVACLGYAADAVPTITVDLLLVGLLIAGFSGAGLLAFATSLYPTVMRSTGVGGAMGLGRLGQVVMPLTTSLMITLGFGSGAVFPLVGVLMLLSLGAILLLRRVGTASSRPSPAGSPRTFGAQVS